MNRRSDDLLEPFPSENERRLCALFRRNSIGFIFPRRFSNCGSSSACKNGSMNPNMSSAVCSFSNGVSDGGVLDDSESEMSESCSSRMDTISVANVVGDDDEFRQLQADLRRSRMVTGVGTQHVMRQYIESRSRNVEARHQENEELSKVKQLPPTERGLSRSFSDRVSKSLKVTTNSSPPPQRDEPAILNRGLGTRISNSFNFKRSNNQVTRQSSLNAKRRGSNGFDLKDYERNSFNVKRTDNLSTCMSLNLKGCRTDSFNNKRKDMIARGMI